LDRVGIVKKLKDINESDYKNIHRFIQGNGKIKYEYLNKLIELFNFNSGDFDLYYHNTKSLVNIDLTYDIDSGMSRFIGFMLGDGWINNNTIGFALGVYEEQNEFYINYAKNKFNSHLSIRTSKHSEFSKSVTIANKELKNIFLKLGFKTGFAKKRIPKWVFNMSLEYKRQLIYGLFDADGSDRYGTICLANKKLITDLKHLCLQSGIGCGIISKRDGSKKLNVKTGKIETRVDSFKLYINFNNKIDDVRLEKIIDVTELDYESVWDLEVESDLHNFIANGCVVHNCLAEDAMLTYRVTRAPERRVFKIFVGNIDEADVPAYVDAIANRFKRTPSYDPATGQMDLRMNMLSNDQDFFIPVRSEDAPNPIDTLAGASNLGEISDIEYLRSNLFTAIRVPKSFLGFDETTGEGKNLALQDIRFARTINRIQQCMLQELNKIALIHLVLLGFEDEMDNFTLTLNNPSTQSEMLRVDNEQKKVTLYKDSVSDAGNGFGVMSMTRAKREILGWSDDDIKQDLLEQRMEFAAKTELANTPSVIKHTGLYDVVDRVYGDMTKALEGGSAGGEGGEDGGSSGGGGGLGGGFGGGGLGSGDLDFGDEGEETEGGTEGGEEPIDDLETAESDLETVESGNDEQLTERLVLENYDKLKKFDLTSKNLNDSFDVSEKNNLINENVSDMINKINDIL
jgi:uncharacterized membrane protein YgcG